MVKTDNSGAKVPSQQQLWRFSLALYPKVQTLCLQWQDSFGVNINLLLLLCYLEQQQLSISASHLQQLVTELEHFSRQFTRPLRTLRRNSCNANVSPAQQHQLKLALLQAELSLEQLEQQLLLEYCPPLVANRQRLIELYLALRNADSADLAAQIIDLRQACHQLS